MNVRTHKYESCRARSTPKSKEKPELQTSPERKQDLFLKNNQARVAEGLLLPWYTIAS